MIFFTTNFFLGGGGCGGGGNTVSELVDGRTDDEARTNLPLQILRSWVPNNA